MHKPWSLWNWSWRVGRWAGVDIRVHWLLGLVLVWLFLKHPPVLASLLVFGLVVSVLLHELGHAFAARTLGLRCEEILIWPLGGLAAVEPNGDAQDEFRIAAAGPLVNATLLAATLPMIALWSPQWPVILNPTQLHLTEEEPTADTGARANPTGNSVTSTTPPTTQSPIPQSPTTQSPATQPPASNHTASNSPASNSSAVTEVSRLPADEGEASTQPDLRADSSPQPSQAGLRLLQVLEILFQINWLLLLVNLLPALPFDGGRMLRAWLSRRSAWQDHTEVCTRVGLGCGIALFLLGMLFLSNTIVMGLGFFVLATALLEQQRHRTEPGEEGGFMGYDFSQGYTSLERSSVTPTPDSESQSGPVQRWREQRQAARQLREQQDAERAEAELDSLLEKVHRQGLESLTESERQTLQTASQRIQQRTGRAKPD